MITLTAKINLLSGDNSALTLGSDDLSGNNISSNLSGIVGVKKNGSNPFIIGASKLGDGSTFSDGVDYFIGNELSDSYGDFVNEYIIDIKSKTTLNTITIAFDTLNKRHPNYIYFENRICLETEYGIRIGSTVHYPIRTNFVYPENNTGVRIAKVEDTDGIITNYIIEDLTFQNDMVDGNIIVNFDTEIAAAQYLDDNYTLWFYVAYQLQYKDNDAIFTLINLPNCNAFSIYIDNWNTPNYPLVLTGIYAEVSIDIDRRNLISLKSSIFERSDLKLPSFGIISNTGNIEFNDLNGEIKDYAEQLLLQSGLQCEIKLNNTLVDGASETIGLFETDEWDYDNDNRVVSVSLKDDLEEWQDIEVEKIPLLERNSMIEIYYQLLERTPSKWKNSNNEFELDDETYRFISKITCDYPYLESGNLWQQWTKFCEVCALHIYKNNADKVVVKHFI